MVAAAHRRRRRAGGTRAGGGAARRRRAARGGGLRGRGSPRRGAGDGARRGARALPRPRSRARRTPCGWPRSGSPRCCALESIGAAVEPARPGLAYFETGRACAGCTARTPPRSPPPSAPESTGRSPPPIVLRASAPAPTRFCALAAALAVALAPPAGARRTARPALARRPAGRAARLPRADRGAASSRSTRLGVRTLGELARLGPLRAGDRFGAGGRSRIGSPAARTRRCGRAACEERLEETMDVGDASSGPALKRVLGVLVDRLLARSSAVDARCAPSRSPRACSLAAAGASAWSFARRSRDPERIGLALSSAPAGGCPPRPRRWGWSSSASAPRRASRGRCSREGAPPAPRAWARPSPRCAPSPGEDAALRAVCVDPDSRVPERRVVLTPLPG